MTEQIQSVAALLLHFIIPSHRRKAPCQLSAPPLTSPNTSPGCFQGRSGVTPPDLLASSLVDAGVDLNPHQVEAALFAFRSPLSQGVILADKVGLGKTIEAGLVIVQRWTERKRRILIITPANLRKQWHQELQDKFSLQALILEAKSYNEQRKAGLPNPFDQTQDQASQIVICSYQPRPMTCAACPAIRWW